MKTKQLFFPRVKCMVCGESLEQGDSDFLCNACLKQLPYNDGATCVRCGRKVIKGSVCGICKKVKNAFYVAYSPFLYDESVKKLISDFKYENRTSLKEFFVLYLLESILRHEVKADLIAYVPMTKVKAFLRGYNQGYLLAKSLGDLANIPLSNDIKKIRATKRQAKLTAEDRRKNLSGAFVAGENFCGKTVLLVDDVLTTGSTANAVSEAIMKSGAKRVIVVTIATTADKESKRGEMYER